MKNFVKCIFLSLFLTTNVQAFFTDVNETNLNFDAINYVYEKNIVGGYEDNTFQPDKKINRAEFTKIIINTVLEDQVSNCNENFFYDVKSTDWFSKYICVAKKNNIISGYDDGSFKPEQSIKFSEAAKIIIEAFEYSTEKDNPWFKPYIEKLAEKSAIPITIDSYGSEISRAELSEIIYRLDAKIQNKMSLDYDGNLINNEINGVEINFATKDNMMNDEWQNEAEIEKLSKDRYANIIYQIETALNKYPTSFLKENLDAIYVFDYMYFYGYEYGGTYEDHSVFISSGSKDWGYADEFVEGTINHEFSSILLYDDYELFDEASWIAANPEGFEYSGSGFEALASGQDSTEFDEEFNKQGFVCQYSMAALEEDFDMMAESLFSDSDNFWTAYDKYDAFQKKADIMINFYNSLDSVFTEEYFRNLNK